MSAHPGQSGLDVLTLSSSGCDLRPKGCLSVIG
jgi:hypothetical protein